MQTDEVTCFEAIGTGSDRYDVMPTVCFMDKGKWPQETQCNRDPQTSDSPSDFFICLYGMCIYVLYTYIHRQDRFNLLTIPE